MFQRYPKYQVFLFLGLCLLFPVAAAASTPTAVVIEVSGPVQVILPDDSSRPLQKGDHVPAGHIVDCGPGGRAVLEIEGGNRAVIEEETRVQIGELFAEEENKFSFSLFLGRLTMALKKLRGDDLVVTPTFVCGVRGTEFSVGVADDGASVVTVSEGRVSVSTDKEGIETPELEVQAGKEVRAETPGAPLTARPAEIKTTEDWRTFRQNRLKEIIPRLPQMVTRLDHRIDVELSGLERTAAQLKKLAAKVREQAEELKSLQGLRNPKRRLLAQAIVKELQMARKLIQRFRRHIMRLRTIFVRAAAFQEKLPQLQDRLGPDYQTIEQGLIKIQARKEEAKNKVVALTADFKSTLKPLHSIWDKFQEFRQRRSSRK